MRKLLVLAALALPLSAAADPCTVTLAVSNVNLSWNLNFTYQPVTFTVTKTSTDACDYGIGFSRGGASTYSRQMTSAALVALSYQLYKDSNLSHVLKDAGDITGTDDVFQGHFDTGSVPAQTLTYYLSVPVGLATSPSFKPFGDYMDTFTINAYEGTNPVAFASPMATQSVSLDMTIPKIVQLSLGVPGTTFDPAQVSNTVAFGNLVSGVIAQRDLLVRTNAGYSVTFSSTNHGVMAHSNPLISTTVPYTLFVNGSPVDLAPNQSAPIQVSGQTSLEGNRNPILIKVGNILSGMAGGYSDTISVSISSTD